ISARWIRETRNDFRPFLIKQTSPIQNDSGSGVQDFNFRKWLIMFIAVLSVKLKIKTYVQIHNMAVRYWKIISQGMDLNPISERQLRERLKKIRHFPGKPAAFIFQLFPELE
ncbi:MAG: hypothetical protein ACR2PH_00820, partial [Desulfobulbia bacterium]